MKILLANRLTLLLLQLGRNVFIKNTKGCISVVTDFNSPGEISSVMFFDNHIEVMLVDGKILKVLNSNLLEYESQVNWLINHINHVDFIPHPAL